MMCHVINPAPLPRGRRLQSWKAMYWFASDANGVELMKVAK